MSNKYIYTFLSFLILSFLVSCNTNTSTAISTTRSTRSNPSSDTVLFRNFDVKPLNKNDFNYFIPGQNGVPIPRKVVAGKPKVKSFSDVAPIIPGISYLPVKANHEQGKKVPVLSEKPLKVTINSNNRKVITFGQGPFSEPRKYAIEKPAACDSFTSGYTIQNGDTVYRAQEKRFPFPQQKAAQMPRFKYDAKSNFQYLDVEQGLAHSVIYTIIEDQYGNLWFGTNDFGISKYDGSFFINYSPKEGLSHDIIRSMFEDKNGNIWIGTWAGGLDKYNGETFTHFAKREGFCNDVVRTIYEDNAGDLWFGTLGSGVFKFDGKLFTQYTKEQGLSNDSLFSILQDSHGDFWFGTWGAGVSKFDGKSFTHITVNDGLSNNLVRSIIEDQIGNLWFGTEGGGLCKYDGNRIDAILKGELNNINRDDITQVNGQWAKTLTIYKTSQGLPHNSVYAMVEDKPGCFWIGTDGGVSYFDGNSFTNYSEEDGLSNNQIRALHKDGAGNLWMGTLGGGICKYTPNSFKYFTEKEGLSDKRVSSMLEDFEGNCWFGTWGGGVCKFDGKEFSSYTEKEGLSDGNITAMLIDKEGDLWFGTERGYVTRFDGTHFTYYTDKHGFSNSQVRTIIEDRQGNIWFGTFDGGITIYDGNRVEAIEKGEMGAEAETNDLIIIDGKYCKTFRRFSNSEQLPHVDIISMMEDPYGNIWIGTNGSGLYKYNGETTVHFSEKDGFKGPFVRSLLADENNNIWIATNGQGVYKFDGKTFTNYSEKDGLNSNNVTSLVNDNHGNLWLGTTNGISYLKNGCINENIEIKQFNFDQQDGLKGDNFRINSAMLDRKNHLWFGSSKALNKLDLNEFTFPNTIPHIQLKNITISNQLIDFKQYKKDSLNAQIKFTDVAPFYNYPLNLVLPYSLNHLTFYFSATDWSAPHKIEYQYKLEGLDSEWGQTTSTSSADYRNIPPGKYTLKLRAKGFSDLQSNTFEYKFEIKPPWWKTLGFQIFCTIGVIGLAVLFYKYRLRTLLRQREQLERKVDKRTFELKQALKELKDTQLHLVQSERLASVGVLSSGLAHEINNPLNFIQGGVAAIENYINRNLGEHLKHLSPLLEMINTGIRRATGIIINLENFNRKSDLNIDTCDIHEIIDNCLGILSNNMRNKIVVEKRFTPEQFILTGNSGDLHQAFLNILINAEESIAEKGKISIFTNIDNQHVEIQIRDTGCGISAENITKITDPFYTTKDPGKGTGFGLSIAFNIIEEHKGTLAFESEPGAGTTVFIRLPFA